MLQPRFHRPPTQGSALVSTMLVIVVLTIIVIAFLQSMTVERQTARSYLNKYRAELAAKAALAEALGRLSAASANSNFHYSVATEKPNAADEYLKLIPKNTGDISVDSAKETSLAILSTEPTASGTAQIEILPAGVSPAVRRTTGWKRVLTETDEEIGRYSFWTGEAAGKQNLLVHSGVGERKQAENLREIPLVKSSGEIFSEEEAEELQVHQLSTKASDRENLFTVASLNQLIDLSPQVHEGDFTLGSSTAILTPEGKPRLNLARLKVYIDGGEYQEQDESADPETPGYTPIVYDRLSLAQGADTNVNKRFELVTQLLNEDNEHGAEKENPWGYGNLEIVKKIFPPVGGDLTQARQFVANLIDYIDDDLIPTTDGAPGPDPGIGGATGSQPITATLPPPPPAPTFLGVEARYDATSGASEPGIVGHPYVTYVGQGFIFNFASGGSSFINSSRVLGWAGMAYPWDKNATWKFGSAGGYQVEMQVTLGGTASGTRGTNVAATASGNGYFQPNWLAQKSGSFASGADALNSPNLIGKAHSYFIYPRAAAGGFDLANGFFTISQVASQLQFTDLTTTIHTLRVIYKVPGEIGGPRFLVQDLRTLSNLPRTWSPGTFSPTASQYKLGGTYGQTDWHFVGDPRLNFKSEGWRLDTTTGSNLAQGTGAVKAAAGETDVYKAAVNDRKDPAQDFQSEAMKWFLEDKGLANHFLIKDSTRDVNPRPSPDLGEPPMKSYAELGFLHAGKPWQTLTLFNDPTRFPDQEALDKADWKLLDYVDLGVLPRRNNAGNQREISGQINVNTGQRNTLKALLEDIDNVPNSQPLVDILVSSDKRPFLTPSSIFALEEFKNNGQTDPEREDLVGRIYPALTTHSQKFLVQCVGEARQNGRTAARVQLVAEVELRPIPNATAGGTAKLTPVVLKTYYR